MTTLWYVVWVKKRVERRMLLEAIVRGELPAPDGYTQHLEGVVTLVMRGSTESAYRDMVFAFTHRDWKIKELREL